MNVLLQILLGTAIVAGIVTLIAFCYWMFWNMMFTPVNKLARYKDKREKAQHEFNVIEAESAELKKFIAEEKETYSEYAVKNADLRNESNKLEDDINRKQKIKKQHETEFKEFNKWKEQQE